MINRLRKVDRQVERSCAQLTSLSADRLAPGLARCGRDDTGEIDLILAPHADAALQKQGMLAQMEPTLFHYMMVSLTAMLAEFGPEMRVTGKLAPDDRGIVTRYWRAVEQMVFGKSPLDSDINALTLRPLSSNRR